MKERGKKEKRKPQLAQGKGCEKRGVRKAEEDDKWIEKIVDRKQ